MTRMCNGIWVAVQSQGQRIRSYTVEFQPLGSSAWLPFSNGTSVGNKRIDILNSPVKATQLRLTVTAAIAEPIVSDFAAFLPCPSA